MKLFLKIYLIFSVICLPTLQSCAQTSDNTDTIVDETSKPYIVVDSQATTISTRFNTPIGFKRKTYPKNSFQYYLSNFPLKKLGSRVYFYNGFPKPNQTVNASVLDIDVGKKDLQQCADAVMRLRAEYLFAQNQFDKIHFNFTNGFKVDFVKWAQGNRIKVQGNNTSWYKAFDKEDYSYLNFKVYMEQIFQYAGTLSLSKELKKIPIDSIEIGDVFIQGGSPGHAVIVIDVAVNEKGEKVFMIAQSYMPAQNIHLLVNATNEKLSPWYNVHQFEKIYSPEWTFEKSDLKRF